MFKNKGQKTLGISVELTFMKWIKSLLFIVWFLLSLRSRILHKWNHDLSHAFTLRAIWKFCGLICSIFIIETGSTRCYTSFCMSSSVDEMSWVELCTNKKNNCIFIQSSVFIITERQQLLCKGMCAFVMSSIQWYNDILDLLWALVLF